MRWACQGTTNAVVATLVASFAGCRAKRAWHALACMISGVAMLLCASARAEPLVVASADYDRLLDGAVEAFEARDFTRARALFEQAYELRPNARVLRGLGIAALQLKRYSTAKRELEAALVDSAQPLTSAQRDGVVQLLAWMQTNLGTVKLQLTPTRATWQVDAEASSETELVLAPGSHRLRVLAAGFDPQERTLQVTAGSARTLDLTLAAHDPKPAVAPVLAASLVSDSSRDDSRSASIPVAPADTTHARDRDSTSVFERWWFWTAVGVVVAGGVAATVALTSAPGTRPYERGVNNVTMLLVHAP
jgi:Tetratricopeptide repeat